MTQQAIFCVFAKVRPKQGGKENWLQTMLPESFPTMRNEWWTNPEQGIAIYAPQHRNGSTGPGSVMSVSGPIELSKETFERLLDQGMGALGDLFYPVSLVLWDARRGELLFARDKFGQTTLYIREFANFFLCSSNLPSLLKAFKRCTLDIASAVRYLFLGQPLRGRTLANEVTKVKAAHWLRWKTGRALIGGRYYTPLRHDSAALPNAKQRRKINAVLDGAIVESAKGEGKALLLSGGVDSSYIAATASERQCGSLEAFTIAFDGIPEANEIDYAGTVAGRCAIKHHIVEMTVGQASAHLDAVLKSAEPCSAWATITHRHLLQYISSNGHKRLLSGLGADEIFGGYSAYLRNYARFRHLEMAWTRTDTRYVSDLLSNSIDAEKFLFSGIPRFFDIEELGRFLHSPFNEWSMLQPDIAFYRDILAMKPNCGYFEMMISHECEHRIPELLFCGFEPIGNEFGIYTSYPFISAPVVEEVIALGVTQRFAPYRQRWKNKLLLREFAESKLPGKILSRTPMSYNAPVIAWLASLPFAKRVIERLHASRFLDLGIIRKEWLPEVQRETLDCLTGKKSCNEPVVNQIWAMLTLCSWYDEWIR